MQDLQESNQELPTQLSTAPLLPLSAVEFIFGWMTKRYGSVFLDMWAALDPEEVKQAWREELAGFSKEELQKGLAGCRERGYPPTLPQFMVMCRTPVDPEAMFYEAVKNMAKRGTGLEEWPSSAVYWAAVKIGVFELRNGTWATLNKRWKEAYYEALANPNLPPIPDRVPALPEPGRTLVREGGLRAIVGEVVSKEPGKAWALKLFRLYEQGDRVEEYAIKLAEQALGRNRPNRIRNAA